MKNTRDWPIWGLMALTVAFTLACVALLNFLILDGVQSYRAEPAMAACEAKRMIPRRRSLSTEVTCIPALTRRDTTTVEVR